MTQPYSQIEQDKDTPSGGNDLPTYDDLVAQHGPNSRFGRWRSWIEKRAAERYNDITPEERQRRRERGWELGPGQSLPDPQQNMSEQTLVNNHPVPGPPDLHIQTSALTLNDSPISENEPPQRSVSPPGPLPFVSQQISPSHLKLNHFGSRFLPHATSQIRCVLPLNAERLLLIGHDEGLSVLDMFPQEWSEVGGIDIKTPDEAQARVIWQGEGVCEMTIIEQEETGDGTTQGVVLVLIGPDPGSPGSRDGDAVRSLRMYNLSSLCSLAKWAIAHKGARPIDLRRPSNWQVQTSPSKRHRPQSSITRSFKSLMETQYTAIENNPVSYHNMLASATSNGYSPGRINTSPSIQTSTTLTPSRRVDEMGWDIVDDVPLRWATDFVPLAASGSRLTGSSVISYAVWTDENRVGRGGQLLAIATRCNILLYETPRGERAFRFVKEFYTPLHPRKIAFFQQTVQEVSRSMSDVTGVRHNRSDSTNTLRYGGDNSRSAALSVTNYGTQLSLFVIFEKKAGWIRIADSAVGEVELPDDSYISPLNQAGAYLGAKDTIPVGSHRVRSRLSFEHVAAPKWILPSHCELPMLGASISNTTETRKVLFLTRGRKTHILPSPLPTNYASYPSLAIVTWKSPPRQVVSRVCGPENENEAKGVPPFLQLIAFGEDGIEVQEMSLNFASRGKGKSKAVYEEVIRAEDDAIGDCGFLAAGGHWDQVSRLLDPNRLSRSLSTASGQSDASYNSYDSVGTSVIVSRLKREQGMYAWCRKGTGDYRVFWVGGSSDNENR